MKFIIPCLASFLITVVVTPLVIRLATACKCLDVPGERRLHAKITPRWGGAAFFLGVLPFLSPENGSGVMTSCIAASCLLVGMGMVDDLVSLGWKTKITVMAAAATIVIFGGNITVQHIDFYGHLGRVDLGWVSIPFTYLSIIGVTNAINLLDGLNGLAGGVSLLGFLFMGIAALLAGNIMVAVICFAFVGALAAFLLYNFPTARIFMGDAGSLFLGFSLSLTAILLTQEGTSPVDTLFPVLVLLLPLLDTLRVLLLRLLQGKNPFRADTLHLHYLFVQNNISPVYVTLLFWSLTALFGSIALTLTHRTSTAYLTAVFSASILLLLFASVLTQKLRIREGARLGSARRMSGMEAVSVRFARMDIHGPGFARTGELAGLKWIAIAALGVVLMAAQAFARADSGGFSARDPTHEQEVDCRLLPHIQEESPK